MALGIILGVPRSLLSSLLQDVATHRCPSAGLAAFVSSLSVGAGKSSPRVLILCVKEEELEDDLFWQTLTTHLSANDIVINTQAQQYDKAEARAAALLSSQGIHYVDMLFECIGTTTTAATDDNDSPRLLALIGTDMKEVATQIDAALSQHTSTLVLPVGKSGSCQFLRTIKAGLLTAFIEIYAEIHGVLSRLACVAGLAEQVNGAPTLHQVYEGWAAQDDAWHYLSRLLPKVVPSGLEGFEASTSFTVNAEEAAFDHEGLARRLLVDSLEFGLPIPSVAAAVEAGKMRRHSSCRCTEGTEIGGPGEIPLVAPDQIIADCHNALRLCLTLCFSQGLALIQVMSDRKGWNIELAEIVKAWQFEGCPLSSSVLGPILVSLQSPLLSRSSSILVNRAIAADSARRSSSLRRVVSLSVAAGVPVPTLSATLSYLDAFRTAAKQAASGEASFSAALSSLC